MISIKNIIKKFGKKTVLNDLSITVEAGSIFCLLGKNGEGKSTLINSMLDLIPIDSGTITINGKNHNTLTQKDKANIGVVAEELALFEELNTFEYLKYIGKIYKIPKPELEVRINDLVNYFFDNTKDLLRSISTYSTGMKKKVAFCASVIHTPTILLLDEPFSNLDPLIANQLIDFLKKYSREDRVIFISSHDLNYVEKISTHIGVLNNTSLQFNSTLEDFTENGRQSIDDALLTILQPQTKDLTQISWI